MFGSAVFRPHFEVFGETLVEPERNHRERGVQQGVRAFVPQVDLKVATAKSKDHARPTFLDKQGLPERHARKVLLDVVVVGFFSIEKEHVNRLSRRFHSELPLEVLLQVRHFTQQVQVGRQRKVSVADERASRALVGPSLFCTERRRKRSQRKAD